MCVVYFNGIFPEVYQKQINKSMQAAETIQEFLKDVGILENLNSDRTPFLCQRESSYLNLAKGKQINLNYADPEYSNGIYNVGIKIIDLKKC